ncbi:hypothetical protein N7478_002693 [Penicillium angulare]|uniref:uncharacterized protein n=1 Tax=Penicillium angulare TaxID=116970 RepID=UPI00253FAEE9|nr:uncharacterized protein N7478_002693 [Penicillium angulare]KAJ5287007.1 hypothetical protein N7478_002693 [Penicillium angulare]
MASVTCGGGNLHMVASAELAVAHLGLDLVAKLPSELAITEITEITEGCSTPNLTKPSSLDMDTPRVKRIDPPRSKSFRAPDSPTNTTNTTHRPREASRPTSSANSIHHSRSASRSTVRSTGRPPSRHSSLHSSRRPVTTASIVSVPARALQQEKQDSLLALHRESCRLFQDPLPTDESRPTLSLQRTTSTAHRSRREGRASSEIGSSVPPSPIASSSSSRRLEYEPRASISSITTPPFLNTRERSNTLPTTSSHVHSPSASSINVPATVMEWTSPSTRRQEYEKIDRASRGMRGLWRRVAPRWCQAKDSRVPFFEEGKTSREGSVRRFRMDLPDEEEYDLGLSPKDKPQVQLVDISDRPLSQDGCPRRLWTGRRSKTTLH